MLRCVRKATCLSGERSDYCYPEWGSLVRELMGLERHLYWCLHVHTITRDLIRRERVGESSLGKEACEVEGKAYNCIIIYEIYYLLLWPSTSPTRGQWELRVE